MHRTGVSLSVFIHFFGPFMPRELPILMRNTEKLQDHRTGLGSWLYPLESQPPGWGMGKSFGDRAGKAHRWGGEPSKGWTDEKTEEPGGVLGAPADFPRLSSRMALTKSFLPKSGGGSSRLSLG